MKTAYISENRWGLRLNKNITINLNRMWDDVQRQRLAIMIIIDYKLLFNMPFTVVVSSLLPNTFGCHVSTLNPSHIWLSCTTICHSSSLIHCCVIMSLLYCTPHNIISSCCCKIKPPLIWLSCYNNIPILLVPSSSYGSHPCLIVSWKKKIP